ncbi:DUF1302 domain-containing protein [Pseudomonas fluorescens]|uniref:DUF1302 domain-containing protein n=1 Tax=Pseudomonas fluorescens TaxID=294 RepID=UPI00124021EB|nr:DUF1302 family protein [Pseudomonas fluorescens]VVM78184.1 hypothetical protein PS639_02131 [Pseudomonas fluorescens]
MKSHNCGPWRRGLLATAILTGGMPAAHAIDLSSGSEDWSIRFDNTVKYNYGVRTESADQRMLGTPNSNDGDYNFRKAGTNISNRIDLLSELDVVYQKHMGFRVSAASWYDKAYENVGSNSNPLVNGNDASTAPAAFGSPHLSRYAQRYYTGPSGEILDAFVFFNGEVGDESLLGIKVGQHNMFWGETLISAVHSLSYGQAGLDLAKSASSPGTEAKELFIPRNQISSSLTVNPQLTLAAQYFFKWDPSRLSEAGTYYGSSDTVGVGAQSLLLGSADPLLNTRRGDDITPDNRGDWGVMAKWSPEWLDGTLGMYYRKTSGILPQAWIDLRGLNPLNNAGRETVDYKFAYGDDIDIYGLSLSKEFSGVSVGSDLNFRSNMPLASITAIYSPALAAGVGPIAPRSGGTGVIATQPKSGDSLTATGNTLHWTLNALVSMAGTPLFDSASLLGELYYSNLLSLDNTNEALYKGKDSYRGVDKSTRDNWGVAINFTPTWYQVFPSVDLSLPLTVNMGLDGISPVQGGGAKDSGTYSLGLSAAIYGQYFVDLKYVDAFGKTSKCENSLTDGATPNALRVNEEYTCYAGGYSSFSGNAGTEDRGAVYLTLKTSF